MSMKLYVGNLSFGTTENDLQQLFSQVGSVESASMVTDRDTGRSRGFAFVEMSSKSEGEAAIAKFNGSELDGRSLTVNEAKPRENRAGGGGGRGGGFSGGRSRY
ncbi:MAG: RNA recognition motif domain-containing protein [Blastocatellia bacterium]